MFGLKSNYVKERGRKFFLVIIPILFLIGFPVAVTPLAESRLA